ncbi:MAG TPA: DNA cytosine methyltransferase [Kofleriaceae bacterium]|nr:DNA cytosine methyltransferase [Kofleriaceae bacterium]
MIVDLFAGAGGASEGIRRALGRDPDVAVNHWSTAIAVHARNHGGRHFIEDVFDVNPRRVCGDEPVELLWMSPDCTHFSKAKGGKPRDKKIRGLAWVATRWAAEVRPRVIALENVEEFETWGPVCEQGQPIEERSGETFREWVGTLRALGYVAEWRVLTAADYGAPTTRKRLFLVARCDGQPITWPEPTHGKGRARPWRTAAEIVDWSLPCPSIFERARPLAEATLRRIATGVRRYVLDAARPFIVPVTHPRDARVHGIDEPLRTVTAANRGELALVAPTLIQTGYGEREGQAPRALDLGRPLGTVVAGGAKHGLVAAFLTKHYGGVVGHELDRPIGTVTTQDHHALTTARLAPAAPDRRDEVRALLDRFAPAQGSLGARGYLVHVGGHAYQIADIGMRMLSPRELFRAQGFGDEYVVDEGLDGAPITKTDQIALAGNSVCPPLAEAIVRANVGAREAVAA